MNTRDDMNTTTDTVNTTTITTTIHYWLVTSDYRLRVISEERSEYGNVTRSGLDEGETFISPAGEWHFFDVGYSGPPPREFRFSSGWDAELFVASQPAIVPAGAGAEAKAEEWRLNAQEHCPNCWGSLAGFSPSGNGVRACDACGVYWDSLEELVDQHTTYERRLECRQHELGS